MPFISADEQRIREIEGMPSDHPSGLGDPCNKREVWDQLLKSGKYDSFLESIIHKTVCSDLAKMEIALRGWDNLQNLKILKLPLSPVQSRPNSKGMKSCWKGAKGK